MPRLIDDLRAKGARLAKPHFVPPDKEKDWAQMAQELSVLLARPDLPVLLIDNVADYYYSSDQEYWDLRDDFPNLAPPYPAFWCESKLATKIHSKQCGDTDMSAFISNSRIGMLIHGLARDQFKGQDIPDNVKWVLWCELFIDYHQRDCTATGPHGSMMLAVDAEGVLVDRPWIQSLSDPRDNDLIRHYITFLHPAFLAMSFLHCKNVTIIDNQVPKPLAKKYQARPACGPRSTRRW